MAWKFYNAEGSVKTTRGTLTVEESGDTPVTGVNHVVFDGATVTDDTGGQVTVTVTPGASTLDALTNVDTTGKADGDILVWDSGTSTWVDAAAPSGSVASGTAVGDLLVWDGDSWEPLAKGTDGQVLTVDAAETLDLKWAAPSGGSGGAALLPLDVVPGSPNAKDDEFTGSSLDAKWTSPISSVAACATTVPVANGWVTIEPTTSGTGSTGSNGAWGIRQVSPTGSFTISARIADGHSDGGTDDGRAGIWVAKTGGKAYIVGHQDSVPRIVNYDGITTYSETAAWSGFDGTDAFIAAPQNQIYHGCWYKIVWNATASTLNFYFSTDGIRWNKVSTGIGSVTQPDRMGIGIWGNAANIRADHSVSADWFRVTEP